MIVETKEHKYIIRVRSKIKITSDVYENFMTVKKKTKKNLIEFAKKNHGIPVIITYYQTHSKNDNYMAHSGFEET